MPVSTRSQIFNTEDENGGSTTTVTEQTENSKMAHALRNPHHGLKEKLKSLTLLYEQQKSSSIVSKNHNFKPQDQKFPPIPALDRNGSMKIEEIDSRKQKFPPILPQYRPDSSKKEEKEAIAASIPPATTEKSPVMKENSMPNATVTKTYVIPQSPNSALDDAKENAVAANGDRIVGFTCPRKAPVSSTVARKLSLGSQMETRRERKLSLGQEMDPLFQKQSNSRNSRILVFVRLRPMMRREKEAGCRSCVRIINRRDVYLTEFASDNNDYLRLKRLRGRHFTFDASFPESASQMDVYSTTTADLVEAVLQGRNGSVFCYGATGAGKTYTMLGTVESPGVMVLAIKDLFTKIRQRSYDGNHVVQLSYLEVYNETVRDLLSPGRPLVLREDKQGIIAAGLSQYRAYSTDEVMALLLQGNKNRTTEPTRANETSSRSHAILQVTIEYRTRDASLNVINRIGKLSLIDLAGSERALATDQRTLRSVEGANINRSLLALSSCINALVEGKKHIPYRNSKLTQLLKDSLGGACNTVMIANISPNNLTFGETQNTLHWADRAKEIRNKGYETNEELVHSDADQAKLLLEVQKENRELRVQLARQQQKLLSIQAHSLAANASPTPPSVRSILTPPSNKQRSRTPLRTTPEPNKKKESEEAVRELQLVVKTLEGEMERLRRDHALQLKKKDEKIRELTAKLSKGVRRRDEGLKSIVTRSSLRSKEANTEVKTSSHRFLSPAPAAKKRSFWDITTANSPSVTTVNGRKTRSHVNADPTAQPSMLLQLKHPCIWSVLILGLHIINYNHTARFCSTKA
ncbi:kinesin-like protein KIN-8A isoform X1 [Chenopodium quinoa]|uniref:kinesin-like protein KIN-8A isoform X1 n=1 Tax=Chenopodium quinoa TaxID=63459 RepID=UPI000B797210|nr:kinesin-like protein KIN-8A isoform X1 [Chenopodium quinoa]